MATTQRLKPSHEKTDSEALEDLASAFNDLDIDGEGLLDQASFLTALRMLGVQLPPSELEEIFSVLDEDDSGMIAYDKLKEFMKLGKIPSTILSKVKSTGNNNAKRTSVIFGAGPMNLTNMKTRYSSKNGGGSGAVLPILNESKTNEQQNPKSSSTPISKERVKMIQRAVIVIKKAAMKNISRKEVIEFLTDKGMNRSDIELAYQKASEQVMSPEEKLKYFTDLSQTRLNELNEQKNMNQYFSEKIGEQGKEIELLRELLKISTDKLIKLSPNKSEEIVSTLAAKELTQRIQQATQDVKNSQEQKNDEAGNIHKRDLETLQTVSQCITNKQHFYAYLYLHQLPQNIRELMPQLQEFLSNFDSPNDDDDDD